MMFSIRSFARVVPLILLGGISGIAQESTGTISGTVTDPKSALVPGAEVTVTSLLTGTKRATSSTSTGSFHFNSLPVGNYEVRVELPGFKSFRAGDIRLDVNDHLFIPVNLQIGEVTQEVTVVSATAGIATESAEVANLVAPTQIENLPLGGRVYSQVLDLFPGISPQSGKLGSGTGLNSDTATSINGGQSNSNVWLVDGVSNMGLGSYNGNAVTPAVDSIEEFKILRSDYNAEFGGGTGGIVNVITKGGTQQFHGSAFEFLRNDKLDATDFFLNSSGGQKSKLRQHDFGATLGGPFWIPGKYNQERNKDFFFFSYEGRRESRGTVQVATVPTARQRAGILDPNCVAGSAGCTPQPFDPMEMVVDEPNVPTAQIDPNGAAMMARRPLPNTSFADHGFNWIDSPNDYLVHNQEMGRWDHYFGQSHRLMFRYIQEDQSAINYQSGWTEDGFPSVNSDMFYTGKNLVANLSSTITAHLLNDFQFGYNSRPFGLVDGSTSDKTLLSRDGFTYTELFPETSGSWPRDHGFDGFDRIKHQSNYLNRMQIFQVRDHVAYTFGAHNLKVGFNLNRGRLSEMANGSGDFTAGDLRFRSTYDVLVGNIRSYQEQETKNVVPSRTTDLAFFVTDNWKIRPNLTVDVGLRWQYLSPAYSAEDNIANFYAGRYDPSRCSVNAFVDGLVDPARCDTLNGIVTPQTAGIPSGALVHRYLRDWEPRLGIAWVPLPSRKLVVRTGAGIFHGRDAGSLTSALGLPPPYNRTVELDSLTFADLASGRLSPFNPDTPQAPTFLQTLDPDYKTPASYQYSLGIQYEFTPRTTLDLGYVGSHQVHQGRNRDINQVPVAYRAGVFDGSIDPNLVRPYLGYSDIYVNERVGSTRYNSLQAFFSRRMGSTVFQAAYAWATTISNTSNSDTEGISSPSYDAYNPGLDKGFASADQRHALTLNYNWEMPFFRNSKGAPKLLLGGWQLSGIAAFRGGLPMSVCGQTGQAGLFGYECERPNLAADPNLDRGQRSLLRYFNTDAYVLQAPGTIGNAGPGVLRGPGVNNWDLSLFKEFTTPWLGGKLASENAKLQFRADLFNAFNHTQFCGVNTDFVPESDAVGAHADPSSGFGTVNCARSPREVQLGLRLTW